MAGLVENTSVRNREEGEEDFSAVGKIFSLKAGSEGERITAARASYFIIRNS